MKNLLKDLYNHKVSHSGLGLLLEGPTAYKRYIENELRKIFDLKGVPLQLEFREND